MEIYSMLLAMLDVASIPEMLRQVGRTQADLARYLGLDPSSLIKTIKGTRQLKATEMVKIEEFFAVADSGPLSDNASIDNPSASPRNKTRVGLYGYQSPDRGERIAMGAKDVVDWIDAPPFWTGPGELVAVRVFGSSMSPRLFAGEIVYAQRLLPPARGRDVLLEFKDGTGLVRTYERQAEGQIFCRRWTPEAEERFAATDVKALHAVIWRR
jgi:transcriptional regulator with XRE-family HTH domain